jgi:protein N-lysine methyltransferase METTL21D
VTYNTASFPSLVRTLDKLVQSSRSSTSDPSPCIILAYKQRDPAERTLWYMLRDIDIQMVLVDKVCGAGGEEVEIWIWNEGHNQDPASHPAIDP